MASELHINTPLIKSRPLGKMVPGKVWLKIEALQPSGSFKLRGIGYACREYKKHGAKQFICSSGGNAGIAVAYSGRQLGIPVTVVVPESTPGVAIDTIQLENAKVIVKGESWQEAHAYSLELASKSDDASYIHPFDDPLLWKGHATLIDEVCQSGLQPDVIVLSVGGGGLLCGVIEGLIRNKIEDVPVIAVETEGAASLSASLIKGKLCEIDSISSIATSLGAKKVSEKAYQRCLDYNVDSLVVSDSDALNACFKFSSDHRLLVEPACGASLSALYNKPLDCLKDKHNILVVVCGGAGVTIEKLNHWKKELKY